MSTYARTSKKGIGYEQLTHTERKALQARAGDHIGSAVYFGRDREGRIHYINRLRGGVVVFDDVGDTDPLHIPKAECRAAATPGAWADQVEAQCGPWRDCRLDRKADSTLKP